MWICPSSFCSALGLNWNAKPQTTKIELEFISDPEMYIFSQKSTRRKNLEKKDGKTLDKLMNKAIFRKVMKNFGNRMD